MQWLLQEFEDTHKLAAALDRLGARYSWHKVVPFVGDLIPPPQIDDPDAVILFGAYTLWRYAAAHRLTPGVFTLRPFVHEAAWHPHLLNGADALFLTVRDIPQSLPAQKKDWFVRPVDDSKATPGHVASTDEIVALATTVLALDEADIPRGSLRHDTLLMLTEPVHIQKEWRTWVVDGEIITASLYKEGRRVVYRPEIDADAHAFAQHLAALNPDYSGAYVIDICRTDIGLKMIETNCINAAGFYAADVAKIACALEARAAG